MEIAAGLEEGVLQPLHKGCRRIVRYEMLRQLACDMACRRLARGEIAQHVDASRLSAIRVALAEHSPVAGLMARWGKEELAGRRCGVGEIADRPAGQDASEI